MLKTFKRFKEFIASKKAPVPIADYYPSHGSHSQEKAPVADYTPSHGKHSIKEEAKEIDHWDFLRQNPNKKIHPDNQGVHEKLNPSKEKWNKLKPDEREAVKQYTGSSFASNKELIDSAHGRPSNFDHDPNDDQVTKNWKDGLKEKHAKITKGLDSLLNRAKTPANLTVLHGINATSSKNFNPGEVAGQHPERHIRMPSYISTTVDPRTATEFAKPVTRDEHGKKNTANTHILRIHLKRGQSGFKYVGDRSMLAGENEGILKRDSVLKVGEHPTIVHHTSGGKIHVWDAHVVDAHPAD